MSSSLRKYPRKTLFLAVVFYITGVITLISWTYVRQHREHALLQKAELTGTTVALYELLKDDAQKLLVDGTEMTSLLAERRSQLDHIAKEGKLALLGMVQSDHANRHILVQSSTTSDPIDLSLLITMANQLTADTPPQTATLNHPQLGSLHIGFVRSREPDVLYFSALDASHCHPPAEILFAILTASLLIALALPLAIISRSTERQLKLETVALNDRLKQDVKLQKSREKELKDAISDLERFNMVSSGRESRIIELKQEVNELLQKQEEEKRYNIEPTD